VQVHNAPGAEAGPGQVATWATAQEDEVEVNAAAVARAGAGLTIPPAELDATSVAQATRQLLEDPSFRRAAHIVADEIALMPSPDDVTTVLETLV
jgi:UDP:flavonoid glycosyltransferase YjiC (YdhE family)